jgi:hypothetical protein
MNLIRRIVVILFIVFCFTVSHVFAENHLEFVSAVQMTEILQNIEDKRTIIETNLKELENVSCSEVFGQTLNIFGKAFKYHLRWMDSTSDWAAFVDWMKDLSVFENKDIVLVVYNFDVLLNKHHELADDLKALFITNILPFWENPIRYFYDGSFTYLQSKKFDVFVIE